MGNNFNNNSPSLQSLALSSPETSDFLTHSSLSPAVSSYLSDTPNLSDQDQASYYSSFKRINDKTFNITHNDNNDSLPVRSQNEDTFNHFSTNNSIKPSIISKKKKTFIILFKNKQK
jgi:hypothetical protein